MFRPRVSSSQLQLQIDASQETRSSREAPGRFVLPGAECDPPPAEVEAGLSYGAPALKVKGTLFARLWEEGETLVLKVDFDSREAMLKAHPDIFFITDHYRGYPAVLVRLAKAPDTQLRTPLEDSWRFTAPKQLVHRLG
jgi:hypothetical protein